MEEQGKFFVGLYSAVTSDHSCPYSAKDFSVQPIKIDYNRYILRITMPAPEITPLCEMLVLTIDFSVRAIRYITVEKGLEGRPFLCEWKLDEKNGRTHLNYGEFSESKLRDIIGWQ